MRLLRVIQEKEIERVGGSETIRIDIRVIAATHRDLDKMLMHGTFREDLYFRLRVFPIAIPPLRQRQEDIPALVQHFIQKKSREMKMFVNPTLAPGALDRLMLYAWPGNARELENAIERELIVSKGAALSFDDLNTKDNAVKPGHSHPSETIPDDPIELDSVMARHIRKVLKMCNGRVEGDKGAAQWLNIHPSTLRKRMKKLGIPFGRKVMKTSRGRV